MSKPGHELKSSVLRHNNKPLIVSLQKLFIRSNRTKSSNFRYLRISSKMYIFKSAKLKALKSDLFSILRPNSLLIVTFQKPLIRSNRTESEYFKYFKISS